MCILPLVIPPILFSALFSAKHSLHRDYTSIKKRFIPL